MPVQEKQQQHYNPPELSLATLPIISTYEGCVIVVPPKLFATVSCSYL